MANTPRSRAGKAQDQQDEGQPVLSGPDNTDQQQREQAPKQSAEDRNKARLAKPDPTVNTESSSGRAEVSATEGEARKTGENKRTIADVAKSEKAAGRTRAGTAVEAATAAAWEKAQADRTDDSPLHTKGPESMVMVTDPVPTAAAVPPVPLLGGELGEASAQLVTGTDRRREFVTADGTQVTEEAVFDDRHPASSIVYAKQAVYERSVLPNSRQDTALLVYGPGQQVPRGEADTFKAMLVESVKATGGRKEQLDQQDQPDQPTRQGQPTRQDESDKDSGE